VIRSTALCLVLLVLLPPAARAGEASSALSRLAEAVAQYPDDPDLAVAYGEALAGAHEPGAAADELLRVEARFPGRRPGLRLRIAALLLDAGRSDEALSTLDSFLVAEPGSGPGHLYRGLALRRLGRREEAYREFQRAAELGPELRSEALLLCGLERMTAGQRAEAEPLLREVIASDPTSEAARRSQLLLPVQPPLVEGPPLSLGLVSGFEYDSNVTLGSNLQPPPLSQAKGDWAGILGAGVVVRPLRGETAGLVLGYRFDTGLYTNLNAYDYQNHLGFGSFYLRAAPALTLRLDGVASYGLLDTQRYVDTYMVRPNLFYSFPDRFGVSRLYADFESLRYFEDSPLSSLDRSGHVYGVGLDHTFALSSVPEALVTVHTRWSKQNTFGTQDSLGFDSAYNHEGIAGGLGLRMPLFWGILAATDATVAWDPYANPNVVAFLTQGGVGASSAPRRRDLVTDTGVSLSRPLFGGLVLELAWHRTHEASNVDLYAYDRNVVGLYFRFQTN
jgi:tetratricopeptide (TPR) repeat protein